MEEYCITMECVYRRAVRFRASDDAEAERKAEELYTETQREDPTAFDDCEWGLCSCRLGGEDIVSWS